MIRVAYEVTSFTRSPFGGIARVCHQTIWQAARHSQVHPAAFYRGGRPPFRELCGVRLQRQTMLTRLLTRPFDIAHGLCHRLPAPRAGKRVYTVHDAWSLQANDYQSPRFQRKLGRRMRREIRAADFVVADSECTRRRLLELELTVPDRCATVHLGVEPRTPAGLPPLPTHLEFLLHQPYVLFVGRLENRKNLGHVLEAVLPLGELGLILVGEPGYGFDENIRDRLAAFPDGRLRVFKRVAPEEMAVLYSYAVATLLPSWEEGFGLPIIEAMACGSPVITSGCSAAAEVAGEAAVLVDPADPQASTEALSRLVADLPFRGGLVAAGYRRAGEFSWSAYFAKLVEIYRRILS